MMDESVKKKKKKATMQLANDAVGCTSPDDSNGASQGVVMVMVKALVLVTTIDDW